jgi:ribose 1,5-bisphosphokinase
VTQGRLIYVVGPSGAGKDSMIANARENLFKNKYLYFAPRYVTRAGGDGHDDLAITPEAFAHYIQQIDYSVNVIHVK